MICEKVEFYLSKEEWSKVKDTAIKVLKNFTIIESIGCWKGQINETIVLIFIMTKEEHIERMKEFVTVLYDALGVTHYVRNIVEFWMTKKPKEGEK